ncbi:hypothetical protein IT413_02290 [Candidatus Peregrinibacteria bacterium]|nr:hypothetical protein [Candidatus Peregrinibacteria bacterium]
MAEATPDKTVLLRQLFQLMSLSKNIQTLPKEKFEQIQKNFQNSSIEKIQSAIALLSKDVEQARASAEKAHELLMKNTQKAANVRKLEESEKRSAEREAAKLIKQIRHVSGGSGHFLPKVLLFVAILAVGYLIFSMMKNQ